MARLTLSFLGAFQAAVDGEPLSVRSARIQALLAYLALESARAHTREALAALFWPDEPDQVAKQNLRQALYQLGALYRLQPGWRAAGQRQRRWDSQALGCHAGGGRRLPADDRHRRPIHRHGHHRRDRDHVRAEAGAESSGRGGGDGVGDTWRGALAEARGRLRLCSSGLRAPAWRSPARRWRYHG